MAANNNFAYLCRVVSDAGSASSVLGQGEEVNVEQRNRATD